nr:immunoglobulin heavy chain junction region [Mus musculus]MBK4195008.1 immunoglobulin heavy chain junction region [Mus musculus]
CARNDGYYLRFDYW